MPVDVARLRRLLEEGTPGPWTYNGENFPGFTFYGKDDDEIMRATSHWSSNAPSDPDAALIVAMHEALPQLLTAIDVLRELEWSQGGNEGLDNMCPMCWAEQRDGAGRHTADCELAALLGSSSSPLGAD